jgi:hypothetical protein
MAGIQVQASGVESHNSLDRGEKMHDPLRRIFKKGEVQFSNRTAEDDSIMCYKGVQ